GAKIGGELQESDLYLIAIQDVSLIHEALEKAKRAEEEVEKKYDELKKTYDTLLAAEEKYKHLYDNSPDLLRTIDLHGMIVDCNKAYAENLGYTRDELIGSSIVKHTAERSYNDLEKGIQEWKSIGVISNIEVWLRRKDGSSFPTLLSGNSLYDEKGNLVGRTVSLRDISDIYQARITIEQ
ncbi:MAG: PAS domain S-box protein, partial [Thaumarchaeota archaeon]|nr:PAS domain S-box protein [Nitrososphaerota archaeon]